MSSLERNTWKECIRHFTPAWYTVIMGTGVTASLIHNFPYGNGSPVVVVFTLIIFFINLVLFTLISGATLVRFALYPGIWSRMLCHPAQSLFVGAFPMGLATLINVGINMNYIHGVGGPAFLYFLWGLWWFDSIVSFLCAFGMVHAMSNIQAHPLSSMAAVWLLPVVSLIVASSTGGLLSPALQPHSKTLAFLTTGFSFLMVIIGLTLALMMITVYLARLIIYGPPDENLILSAFIVLGPLGQGGYSMLLNGANLAALFPEHVTGNFPRSALTGQLLYSFTFCVAYVLWSMGICWVCIGLLSVFSVVRQAGMPKFGLAYWGLVFPNGVYSLLCVRLGLVLDSGFFRGFGAFWTCITFSLWAMVMIRSVLALIDRSIFSAPSLVASLVVLPPSPSDTEKGDKSSWGQVSSQLEIIQVETL